MEREDDRFNRLEARLDTIEDYLRTIGRMLESGGNAAKYQVISGAGLVGMAVGMSLAIGPHLAAAVVAFSIGLAISLVALFLSVWRP